MNKQRSHEVSTHSNTQDFLARLEQKELRALPQDLSFDEAVVFVATGSEEQVNEFRISDVHCPVEWLGSDVRVRRASKFLDDCARKGRIAITGILGIEAHRNHIPVDSYQTLSLKYHPGSFARFDPVGCGASRDFVVPSKGEGRNLDILSGCLDDFMAIEPEDLVILRRINDLLIISSDLVAVISDVRGNDETAVPDSIAIELDDCAKADMSTQKERLQTWFMSRVTANLKKPNLTKKDLEKIATGNLSQSDIDTIGKDCPIGGVSIRGALRIWEKGVSLPGAEAWSGPGRKGGRRLEGKT